MERALTLIRNEGERTERRLLPRFPLSLLVFKEGTGGGGRVFEIRDISPSGMRIERGRGAGPPTHGPGDRIEGRARLRDREVGVRGTVRWARGPGLGVAFDPDPGLRRDVGAFLAGKNAMRGIRRLHDDPSALGRPEGMSHWLRSDGAFELFVWDDGGGGVARFLMLFAGRFAEWRGPLSLQTGTVPHAGGGRGGPEGVEERLLRFDPAPDAGTAAQAAGMADALTTEHLPADVLRLVRRKLRERPLA